MVKGNSRGNVSSPVLQWYKGTETLSSSSTHVAPKTLGFVVSVPFLQTWALTNPSAFLPSAREGVTVFTFGDLQPSSQGDVRSSPAEERK